MEIKDLEYIRAVCECKSITRASRQLYLTPQGLSKIIKNVENELNTTLFIRTPSGMELTESGKYLYEQLPELLDSYAAMASEIRCIEQSQNHEIDLLSAYGILRLVTPECLEAFREEYPHITLNYREYPDREVDRLFRQGQGNVAFNVGNNRCAYAESDIMDRFEIKLLVNRSHPFCGRESVTVEDLKGQKLYLESTEFNIHHLIVEECRSHGFDPDIVFQTSGFGLCHKMVQKNHGISVTMDFMFDDMYKTNLVTIPFADGPFYWETCILKREGSVPNPDVELFCAYVKNWMQAIHRNEIQR